MPPSTDSPSARRKRASKACSRCRRYRIKCFPEHSHLTGVAPCAPCSSLGVQSQCTFLPRGQSYLDRSHRRREKNPLLSSTTPPAQDAASSSASLLPPPDEVVEAIRKCASSYFQLHFLHKALFIERYLHDPESIPTFLLLAICSVAAAFTPPIVERYGGKKQATDIFLDRAEQMFGVELLKPSLERAQAFLLLGVAEWGRGNGAKAWMLIGTAVRMAGFLGLHREITYELPPDPTAEQIIESEVARRTFWAITCHENLLSGQSRPIQMSLAEIDALLPCEESDFNFGILPKSRSSLAGTLSAQPANVNESRSLFASLIQVKTLWCLIARHASRGSEGTWTASSQSLLTALQDFEVSLPVRQRFNLNNLRGWTVEGLDLAYLSISVIMNLSNIVIRRMYLASMAAAIDPEGPVASDQRDFWQGMAHEMVKRSETLLNDCGVFFSIRSPELGFPPIQVFGIFMCGNVFSYLWKWPELCRTSAPEAESSFNRCVDILAQLSDAWQLASHWHASLLASKRSAERQRGRFRATVRDEQTLDDELTGIFGPRTHAVISPAGQTNPIAPVPVATEPESFLAGNDDFFFDFGLNGEFNFDSFSEDLTTFVHGGFVTGDTAY